MTSKSVNVRTADLVGTLGVTSRFKLKHAEIACRTPRWHASRWAGLPHLRESGANRPASRARARPWRAAGQPSPSCAGWGNKLPLISAVAQPRDLAIPL